MKQLMMMLKSFKFLTMLRENRGVKYGSIGTTLWGMDILLEMLEKARERSPPNNAAFRNAIDEA